MRIKTTQKYHLITVKKISCKNASENVTRGNTHILLPGMFISVATMKIKVEVSLSPSHLFRILFYKKKLHYILTVIYPYSSHFSPYLSSPFFPRSMHPPFYFRNKTNKQKGAGLPGIFTEHGLTGYIRIGTSSFI